MVGWILSHALKGAGSNPVRAHALGLGLDPQLGLVGEATSVSLIFSGEGKKKKLKKKKLSDKNLFGVFHFIKP